MSHAQKLAAVIAARPSSHTTGTVNLAEIVNPVGAVTHAQEQTGTALDPQGVYPLIELVRATKGLAPQNGGTLHTAPVGLTLALAQLDVLEAVTGADLTACRSLIEGGDRNVFACYTGSDDLVKVTLGRIQTNGGGNNPSFNLAQLDAVVGGREAVIDLLLQALALRATSQARFPVKVPVGVTRVVIVRGHAEYLVEINDDGTLSAEAIPYRQPQGGERWRDAAENEYLIVQGAALAIRLRDGTTHPLQDGAIADTTRGVNFFFHQGA